MHARACANERAIDLRACAHSCLDAVERIADGAMVRVNGDAGTISLLDAPTVVQPPAVLAEKSKSKRVRA
jgi:hypothetical protein